MGDPDTAQNERALLMGHGPRPRVAEDPGDRQGFPVVPKVGHRFREALGRSLCCDRGSGQRKGLGGGGNAGRRLSRHSPEVTGQEGAAGPRASRAPSCSHLGGHGAGHWGPDSSRHDAPTMPLGSSVVNAHRAAPGVGTTLSSDRSENFHPRLCCHCGLWKWENLLIKKAQARGLQLDRPSGT